MRKTWMVMALALVPAGCGEGPAGPTDGAERVQVHLPAGVEQAVTLSETTVRTGDTLWVRSVVRARGDSAVALWARICGLDLEGLELHDPFGRCAAYSMQTQLAPGDSLVQVDQRLVTSAPGDYTLRVRHVVQPDTWVELPVRVRAP